MLNILFYLQSEGYLIRSFVRSFLRRFVCCLIVYSLLIIVELTLLKFDILVKMVNDIIFLFVTIFAWIFIITDFKIIKLKFTKRACRIFCVCLFLCLILFMSICFIDLDFVFVFLIGVYISIPILLVLSLVILQPFEYLIKKRYIKIAQTILSKQKSLIKIGITGSYGKTSVKEILYSILSTTFYTLSTPKSFNTPFGLTKTITSDLLPIHQVLIAEMGAKKKGEIDELCRLIDVDFGIVTAVGRQHTNTFGSIDNIYKTKKELPDYILNKFCVFNLNNHYVAKMHREYIGKKIGVFIIKKHNRYPIRKLCVRGKFSFVSSNSDFWKNIKISKLYQFIKLNNVYAKNIEITEELLIFDIYYSNNFVCSVNSSLIGMHNIINILLATAMAIKLNVSSDNIKYGIANLKSINARFEKKTNKNGAVIINNGYNSNLDSAKYSLNALKMFSQKNKIVVTPGLIDCIDSYQYNYEFGKLLSKYCTEVVIVKKINRKAIFNGLIDSGFDKTRIYFANKFNDLQAYINNATSNDVILIENDLPDNFK